MLETTHDMVRDQKPQGSLATITLDRHGSMIELHYGTDWDGADVCLCVDERRMDDRQAVFAQVYMSKIELAELRDACAEALERL